MSDITYQKFVKQWERVTDLPPQTLGPLTPVYKMITRRLKVMPWPWVIVLSAGVVTVLYYLIGSTVVFLTSLLQRGF